MVLASIPFRTLSGTFGSAFRLESSTGGLHHVMVRGIEGRPLFRDDEDYQAWVDRFAAVAPSRAVLSYLGTQQLGIPQMAVAQFLGVTPAAVHFGVGRGPGILAARGLRAEELLPPSGRGIKQP